MFVNGIGRGAQRIIDAMVRWLAYGHINPNILTVIGVAINVGSGLLFGLGYFFSAGIVLIIANLFALLDVKVPRLSGRVPVSVGSSTLHSIAFPTWSCSSG